MGPCATIVDDSLVLLFQYHHNMKDDQSHLKLAGQKEQCLYLLQME